MSPAPEVILVTVDRLFVWRGPRPGMTFFGAQLGRLQVTTRRLVFLSAGSGIFAVSEHTEHLDAGALARDGSLDLPIERVSARVTRRWDGTMFLAVTSTAGDGSPASFAFMARNGFDRRRTEELVALEAAVEKAQQQRLANPYRS